MLPACRRCRNRVAGSDHAIPSNSRMADIEIEVISSCSFEAFPKLPEIFYTNVNMSFWGASPTCHSEERQQRRIFLLHFQKKILRYAQDDRGGRSGWQGRALRMTGAPLIPWSLPPVILRSDSNEESFIMHHDLRIKKAPCKALQRVFGVSNNNSIPARVFALRRARRA